MKVRASAHKHATLEGKSSVSALFSFSAQRKKERERRGEGEREREGGIGRERERERERASSGRIRPDKLQEGKRPYFTAVVKNVDTSTYL